MHEKRVYLDLDDISLFYLTFSNIYSHVGYADPAYDRILSAVDPNA